MRDVGQAYVSYAVSVEHGGQARPYGSALVVGQRCDGAPRAEERQQAVAGGLDPATEHHVAPPG